MELSECECGEEIGTRHLDRIVGQIHLNCITTVFNCGLNKLKCINYEKRSRIFYIDDCMAIQTSTTSIIGRDRFFVAVFNAPCSFFKH